MWGVLLAQLLGFSDTKPSQAPLPFQVRTEMCVGSNIQHVGYQGHPPYSSALYYIIPSIFRYLRFTPKLC